MLKKKNSTTVEPPETVTRSGDTVERVAAILKSQILDGTLVPGQRLISRDLIEELGISRGPLREAFRRLAADRLIELIPNRGAIVRRLTRTEIIHLFEIREALEGQAARLAAKRIDLGKNRAYFEAIVKQGQAQKDRLVMSSFIAHNREFHQAIVKISDNPELAELIDRYQLAMFMTLLRQVIGAEQIIKNSIEQHEAIAAAILAGDPEQAYEAMRLHLWHSANGMLDRDRQKTANALQAKG
ncbi:GntR family transcriptional regulator [Pollutimonas harenae]|uniref:GntR family transcriptional regulator n=1 Tax=Pollutimonas harenae TaxID=657015 RepID=A0A853GVB5_9BURK|nr:GntR family transcriptional regulator [Pollutimonas harenae]NYT84072.1 GntR family transcriptional regulator [Pollutimonas harenae]TEA73503.1 GntR family transcriptional regulator [Pollutimonas harenae]